MKEFIITNATPQDVEQILQIDRACLDGFWSELSYLNELNNDNTDMIVIRSAEEVLGVGAIWLYWEEAHIIMLAIKPEYQNQGLGSAIIWQMLQCAHRFGAEWVVLEVRASNNKAIDLYKRFDFIEVGKRREYYSNNREDALILWCKRINTLEFARKLALKQTEIVNKLSDRGWHWLKGLE